MNASMTRRDAIEALAHWSRETVVPASVLDRLAACAEAGEAPLDTAVRLACGRGIARPAAFDHRAVAALVAMAEVDASRAALRACEKEGGAL